MKTNKYTAIFILGLIATGLTSCGNYYRITSHINSDGSMYREVYAEGDSAFRTGNMHHSPFLFQIGTGWELTKLDSAFKCYSWGDEEYPDKQHLLDVKVSRKLATVGDPCFETVKGKEYMKALVVPEESLKKEFRWFRTNYKYKAVYKELPDKGPVSLSKFMTQEEQNIWLKGDDKAFARMNGKEQIDELDNLQTKFWEWYNRSLYEVCYETICETVAIQKDATDYLQILNEDKEAVYHKYFVNRDTDISVQAVCKYLDEQKGIKYFAAMYEADKATIEARFDEKSRITELFNHRIWFEVTMPGNVTTVNEYGIQQKNGSIIWKVDAFRILSGDYVLEAESSTINYWAFAVTAILIVLAIIGYRKFSRKARL